MNRFNRILDKRSTDKNGSEYSTNNNFHPRLQLEPINEVAKPSHKKLREVQQDTERSNSPMRNSFEVAVNKLDFYTGIFFLLTMKLKNLLL